MASLSGVLTVGSHFLAGARKKTQSIFFITGIVLASVRRKIVMEIIRYEVRTWQFVNFVTRTTATNVSHWASISALTVEIERHTERQTGGASAWLQPTTKEHTSTSETYPTPSTLENKLVTGF